jgi:anthranilate synthase component 1
MYSPSLEEFQRLAARGNLIPVTRRLLADFETPLSAYSKIRGQGESFLFESIEGGEHLGRYSFVGCNPRAIIRQNGARIEVIENGRVVDKFAIPREPHPDCDKCVRDGLEVVEQVLKHYRPVPLPGLPRFTGGAVGFIGYEFIHDIEPVVPRPPHDELHTPTLYFLIADELLIFDRVAQTLTVLVNAVVEPGANAAEAYDDAISEIDRIVALLEQPVNPPPVTLPREAPDIPFQSNVTPEKFHAHSKYWQELLGQAGGAVRRPLLELTDAEKDATRRAFESCGLKLPNVRSSAA